MSIQLERSAGTEFDRSPGGARNTPRPSYVSGALSIFPYQGFGNKFDTSIWSTWSYKNNILGRPGAIGLNERWGIFPSTDWTWSSGAGIHDGFIRSDLTYTYQTVTCVVSWSTTVGSPSPSSGSETIVSKYYTYWKNGFGLDTFVETYGTQTGTFPVQLGSGAQYGSAGCSVVATDTVVTATILMQGFVDSFHVTVTMTLSDKLLYSDVVTAALTALDTLSPPPAPVSSDRFDIVWPNTASTNSTTTSSTSSYRVCASFGILTDDSGLVLGGSLTYPPSSLNLPADAIVHAKTQWLFGNNYLLNNKPLDSTTYQPQPIVGLATIVPNAPGVEVFSPSTITELSHTGSDVPPNAFTPPYSPPYSPSGLGEIGINPAIV